MRKYKVYAVVKVTKYYEIDIEADNEVEAINELKSVNFNLIEPREVVITDTDIEEVKLKEENE